MAISPINVATRGLLNSPLGISVDGYLGGVAIVAPGKSGGGSSGPYMEDYETRIHREDEELLAIIIAATKVLH